MKQDESSLANSWIFAILEKCVHYFTQQGTASYAVGGTVRDLLLHNTPTDWDLAVSGPVQQHARRLADQLNGFYAHMHEKASRIIVKRDEQTLTIDLAPLHPQGIEADLHERDFTLNAIALPLQNLPEALQGENALQLVDPLHGAPDLAQRHLRAVNDEIFLHDPLRLLRAVRFLLRYQLTLTEQTRRLVLRDAPLLIQAATERIHEELYIILEPPEATRHLRLLDELGLFSVLFPELQAARSMPQPSLHHWDVFEHSLETASALEQLLSALQGQPEQLHPSPLSVLTQTELGTLHRLLQEAEEQNLFHFSQMLTPTMKLASFLHDIGKTVTYTRDEQGTIRFYDHPQAGVPLAQQVMQRLGASMQQRRLVQQVVANHMRPGQLSHTGASVRAIRRYFVELGPTGISVALISLADHLSMRGPEVLTPEWERHLATVNLLLTRYIRERESILPPRLLQAEELIQRLDLKPGPIIGQLLEAIAEAQAEGQIHSKDEALWLAEDVLQQRKR